jgi:hypothetical protein
MANKKITRKATNPMSERAITEEQVKMALTTRIKIFEATNQALTELLDRYEAVHSDGECSCSPEWKALSLIQFRTENMIERAKEILGK